MTPQMVPGSGQELLQGGHDEISVCGWEGGTCQAETHHNIMPLHLCLFLCQLLTLHLQAEKQKKGQSKSQFASKVKSKR